MKWQTSWFVIADYMRWFVIQSNSQSCLWCCPQWGHTPRVVFLEVARSYKSFVAWFCPIPGSCLEGSEQSKYLWLVLKFTLRWIQVCWLMQMWYLNSFVQDSIDLLLSEEERRMYDWSLLRKATHTVDYAWPYEADITQSLVDKTPLPVFEYHLLHL